MSSATASQNGGTVLLDWLRDDGCGGAQPVSAGLIHLGVAKEIYPVLADLGATPEKTIAEAGLDPGMFRDGGNLIPVVALGRLLRICVEQTSCAHFGLLVGQRASLRSLRLVGRLMESAPTVGDALRDLETHLRIQNRSAVVKLDVSSDTAILSYSLYHPGVDGAAHILDCGLAAAVNALRDLCGPNWRPLEVLLPRTAPVNAKPYIDFFRAPVRFNQELAAIVLPAQLLNRPNRRADEALHCALKERAAELEAAAAPDLRDDLRRLLRTESLNARCSSEAIARRLSVHRRTLSRRLRGVGAGFKVLADEVRFEIARQLLTETDMPLAQVSAALDFSEPAAFTRAFRRWSGQAPSEWRIQRALVADQHAVC